jgi:hypothetical protein
MATALTRTFRWVLVTTFVCIFGVAIRLSGVGMAADTDEDTAIAEGLGMLLSAGLEVISINQDLIDNPDIGEKGLDGKTVLAKALQLYQKATGSDAETVDPTSRRGRLLRVEMSAIVEVMDAQQKSLNKRGIGFKGFIPQTFARLIVESFNRGAAGDAEIKLTAPPELVRNRKSRPDSWESAVIREKFLSASWPKGQSYAAIAESKGRPAFRIAVPDYYSASCLSCHGGPKGQTDITGYPKEGANAGDLGAVISITLYR